MLKLSRRPFSTLMRLLQSLKAQQDKAHTKNRYNTIYGKLHYMQ